MSIRYDNRYWIIIEQDCGIGAFWFNPQYLQRGFVTFNTTLPTYMSSISYETVDEKIIYSVMYQGNSHVVKIIIDLTTGETVTNDEGPEMLFNILIFRLHTRRP